MTTIFIFAHFGLIIHHSFLYFVTLKGFVCIIGKLVWLYCSDKIVKPTWQRIVIKIVKYKKKKTWYDIFAIFPTPNLKGHHCGEAVLRDFKQPPLLER